MEKLFSPFSLSILIHGGITFAEKAAMRYHHPLNRREVKNNIRVGTHQVTNPETACE